MTKYTIFDTKFCKAVIAGDSRGISNTHFETIDGKRKFKISSEWIRDDSFFIEEKKQMLEYFKGKRKEFSIKLNPQGTEFQQLVWKELLNIPFGKTRTYKDIAISLGNPNASRAIGMANSKNPVPLFIPCHRVIGSNGNLTGFAHGLDLKKKLLQLENYRE